LLIEIRITGQDPRAGRHHVRLDAAVVRGTTAGEGRHLLRIAGRRITLDGVRGVIRRPGCAVGGDHVLAALAGAGGVGQRRIALPVARTVVLAGADGQHILGRGRRAGGVIVDGTITVRVDALVAGRKGNEHVLVAPHEGIGIGAVGRVVAGGRAAPRVRVHARSCVVSLQEERADVSGQAGQIVPIGNSIELAQVRGHNVVFGGLEHQPRGRRCALAESAGIPIAEHGGGHVGAVPAVHIDRAVIIDRLEATIGAPGPVVDRGDARGWDIRVRSGRCAAAQAGVCHCDDLGRAVIAAGISGRRTHQAACAVLVVLLAQHEGLDPRDIHHVRDRNQLRRIGCHDEDAALLAHDLRAGGSDRGASQAKVGPTLHPHGVQARGLLQQCRVQLVCRLEDADTCNRAQRGNPAGLGRVHPDLEREIREIVKDLSAQRGDLVLPRLLDGAAELDDVITPLARCVFADDQSGRNIGGSYARIARSAHQVK